MSRRLRVAVLLAAVALLVAGGWWLTGRSGTRSLPDSLCGTRVQADLLNPLLPPEGEVSVEDRVERKKPNPSSWCAVYVKGETAVRLRFSWHSDRIDPMRIADSTSPILGLEDPRRVEVAGSRAVAGNNGSIATTPCETRGGSQFTLAVLLDGGFDTNRNADRSDLEAFMKAYFPATVETLGCA